MITVHRALCDTRFGTLPRRNSLRPDIPRLPTIRTSTSAAQSTARLALSDRSVATMIFLTNDACLSRSSELQYTDDTSSQSAEGKGGRMHHTTRDDGVSPGNGMGERRSAFYRMGGF